MQQQPCLPGSSLGGESCGQDKDGRECVCVRVISIESNNCLEQRAITLSTLVNNSKRYSPKKSQLFDKRGIYESEGVLCRYLETGCGASDIWQTCFLTNHFRGRLYIKQCLQALGSPFGATNGQPALTTQTRSICTASAQKIMRTAT